MKEVSSDKFASIIARILDDKQGKDIKILNISNISVLADYFVICSSDSSTHVKALTGSVREKITEFFEPFDFGLIGAPIEHAFREEVDDGDGQNVADHGGEQERPLGGFVADGHADRDGAA